MQGDLIAKPSLETPHDFVVILISDPNFYDGSEMRICAPPLDVWTRCRRYWPKEELAARVNRSPNCDVEPKII
jgi:hypothetical protein